jgi:AcrR family transcriptional regulator
MSKSSTKPTRLSQAERVAMSDEKMINAAIELILETGKDKLTLKEVGERAGYSRGLASMRFGSKEELFKRILHAHREGVNKTIKDFTAGTQGLNAILCRIDSVEHMLTSDPQNVKAIYTLWFDSLDAPSVPSLLRKELIKYNSQSRNELTSVLNDGIANGEFPSQLDVHQFVIDYYCRIYGLMYQWLVSPEEVDLSKSFKSLKSFCQIVLGKSTPESANIYLLK